MERAAVKMDIDFGRNTEEMKPALYSCMYDVFKSYGGEWLTVKQADGTTVVVELNGDSDSIDRMIEALTELGTLRGGE